MDERGRKRTQESSYAYLVRLLLLLLWSAFCDLRRRSVSLLCGGANLLKVCPVLLPPDVPGEYPCVDAMLIL
jgi:hypothetical protein